ncbi:MAG: glycosyl hydrolase 53 family protein [Eubacterium sp.]
MKSFTVLAKRTTALLLVLAMCLSLAACKSSDGKDNSDKKGEDGATQEAGITVLPVEGLSEDFVMGVDISSLIAEEESGVVYYDADGNEADLFSILKDSGVNCIRIRVWNDPYDSNGNSYGAGNCDIENAVKIGKRATDYGMGVLIDFHYSDFWADPNKQRVPKAWEGFTIDEKVAALSEYTTDCLNKLKDGGVDVTMVQIGNEINNGMSGETSDVNVCKLLAAGADAVREFDSDIQIVVHYTDPLSDGYLAWKASLLKNSSVDYDILATSYYPFWHGDLAELTKVLKDVADTYGVKVMVAETSYAYTDNDGDGYGNIVSTYSSNQTFNYPVSVEGQAVAVRDVIEAVSNVGDAGVGVFYWEPAWIPVNVYDTSADNASEVLTSNKELWEKFGSGWATSFASEYDPEVTITEHGGTWDNQAFFDFEGHVLESLNVFKYVYTGAKGPISILRVDNPSVDFEYGAENALPEQVTVIYNDGTSYDAPVTWNEDEAAVVMDNPDFGEYTVTGKVDEITIDGKVVEGDYNTICTVKVTANNYVTNGTFETGEASDWTIVNETGAGWPKVDKNEANAKEGSYYYTAWAEDSYDFTISQEIQSDIPKGKYKCFAYFQGTGITNPTDTQLLVSVTSKEGTIKEYSAEVTIKNVWKDWFKAEISDIIVDENTETVTVGAHIACTFQTGSTANGAWIVMDDVNLVRSE